MFSCGRVPISISTAASLLPWAKTCAPYLQIDRNDEVLVFTSADDLYDRADTLVEQLKDMLKDRPELRNAHAGACGRLRRLDSVAWEA